MKTVAIAKILHEASRASWNFNSSQNKLRKFSQAGHLSPPHLYYLPGAALAVLPRH